MKALRLALLIVLLSMATDVSFSVAAPLLKGDFTVWNEIIEAYTRLNALCGYRMKIVVSLGGGGILERGVLEAAYPNVRHLRLQVSGSTITEGIDAGKSFRALVNVAGYPKGWQCTGAPQTRPLDDPQDITGRLLAMRRGDTVIGGMPMHVYSLSSGTPPNTVQHTIYVKTQTGLPYREVLTESYGNKRITAYDYYDYGAKINIPVPACQ
jgi:hypothetical protein